MSEALPGRLDVTAVTLCPVHREPLRREGDELVGASRGERYPIVDGIPILIADRAERREVSGISGESARKPSALDFYNRPDEGYFREALEDTRGDMTRWLREAPAEGPVLEIGSGRGALAGFGGDAGYLACDYSLTSLRAYLRPELARVCASAERLPFPDATFRFLFTIATLEHLPNPDRAFAEIDRVLAPGGVAYVAPAWHCVQYNCEGIPVRPYRDLDLRQKFVKATLPLRQHVLAKALGAMPSRLAHRARFALTPGPTPLRFGRLTPDYVTIWTSDSDAASSLDAHEGCLFFHSRGYEVLRPGPSARAQLLARHAPVVVRKPTRR